MAYLAQPKFFPLCSGQLRAPRRTADCVHANEENCKQTSPEREKYPTDTRAKDMLCVVKERPASEPALEGV